MKHHKAITTVRKPQLAQSNFEEWKDFLVELLDQVIEFIFIRTR